MNSLGRGIVIASAAASLILAGNVVARAQEKAGEAVHCAGLNECKGKGSCAGAENACKAKNECKGKGWIETSSAAECTQKGGKVVAAK
ncbi:MAG: hypothetical protein L0221_04015 [Chloroflexi bacterium]|nr:hypothetical protein [Chloroflexota bacterium]